MPRSVAARWAGWAQTHANTPGPFSASPLTATPTVVEIPFEWISTPLSRKPTTAITRATVTQRGTGGALGQGFASAASTSRYGVNAVSVTVDTATDADAQNLAEMLTTYQATPRPRQPTMMFNLLARTDMECQVILSVVLAQRVRVVGAPPATPPGALNFTVEGIAHALAVDKRLVTWSTSALIGGATADPGPWFQWGSSSFGGTHIRAF